MFKKKKCENCGKKTDDKFLYCPYCGDPIGNQEDEEDFGMLGKNDKVDEFEEFSKSIFGGIGGKMFNKMLGNAMKTLEKEMQKEMNNRKNMPRTNFELYINGKRINTGNMVPEKKLIPKEKKDTFFNRFSTEDSKKFSKLPKTEPETKLRRLSKKIIYEINMPEVKSIKDISVTNLENSIEIRAITDDKAYFKLIPISLPIISYNLNNGTLVLELEARN